jgi:plasmid maintenance system antidote protein VapI
MIFVAKESTKDMNFQDLHELVRLELVRRIERGALTGTRLAQQAGFQQAHISNFLNRKRALSLEGLDRVLSAQDLRVEEILPLEITAGASRAVSEQETDPVEMIPIVSPSSAMEDVSITPSAIIDSIPIASSRLSENRARPAARRTHWQRFLALRTDAQQATAMAPLLPAGSITVIDRHYNSLVPYRANHASIFAVRSGPMLLLRHVDFDERHLILKPYVRDFPVQLLPLLPDESPGDYIVGRVCLVLAEL